jgi:hypothetical protein
MAAPKAPHFTARADDRVWDLDTRPTLDEAVIRHLGAGEGWEPGMAPVALVRGHGHHSHVTINGWPYVYIGTTDDGDTLYESY